MAKTSSPCFYPANDDHFEDVTVAEVQAHDPGQGWTITRSDGWSFSIPAGSPVEPAVGMTARFYGAGIGYQVRGLFLAGVQVFYRTEADDKAHQEVEAYGRDAADWLSRWDAGRTVWSIEMGGLGPGYEQCIQITTAEALRVMLAEAFTPERWRSKEMWQQDRDKIEAVIFEHPGIKSLGLSGAQWGAALSLARQIYSKGPIRVMGDPDVKDRHIQVSRVFPQIGGAA